MASSNTTGTGKTSITNCKMNNFENNAYYNIKPKSQIGLNDKLEQRQQNQMNEPLDTWQKGKMDDHLEQINQASRSKERAQTTEKAGKRSKNLYILSATSNGA